MMPKSIQDKPKINEEEQKEKEAALPINKDGLKFYEKKTQFIPNDFKGRAFPM